MQLGKIRLFGMALTATLAACGSPSSKHSDSPDQNKKDDGSDTKVDDGKGSGEKPGAGSSTKPAASGYAAKGGDTYDLETQSKQWSSDAAEPNFGAAAASESAVIALYKSGLSCKYRAQMTASGVISAYDYGCEALACSGDNQCKTKDIANADVGQFKGAKGTETTCQYEQGSGAAHYLVKTVTQAWSHADALREGQLVKTDLVTCSLALVAGDVVANLDACAPPSGRATAKTRSLSTLTSQKRGAGTADLQVAPSFKFTATGDFSEPAQSKNLATSCTLVQDQLAVSLTKGSCDANHKTVYETAMLSRLPKELGTDIPAAAYGVILSANLVSYMATTAGACKISATASGNPKMISGSATCDAGALSSFQTGGKESLSDLSFSCFAPAGL